MSDKRGLYSRTGVVFRKVNRPSKATVAAFADAAVADVHETMGDCLGYRQTMRPDMRPVRPGQRIAGTAVTAFAFPGDNLMMHLALSLTEPGDIVVVNSFWSYAPQSGGSGASWGKAHGINGLITDGAVRDLRDLERLDFAVWSTSIAPGKVNKGAGAGAVNVPISCGGVIVNPGDIIVADDDGVIVVPREIADEIAAETVKKANDEKASLARLNTANALPPAAKFAEIYRKFGMAESDGAWDDP